MNFNTFMSFPLTIFVLISSSMFTLSVLHECVLNITIHTMENIKIIFEILTSIIRCEVKWWLQNSRFLLFTIGKFILSRNYFSNLWRKKTKQLWWSVIIDYTFIHRSLHHYVISCENVETSIKIWPFYIHHQMKRHSMFDSLLMNTKIYCFNCISSLTIKRLTFYNHILLHKHLNHYFCHSDSTLWCISFAAFLIHLLQINGYIIKEYRFIWNINAKSFRFLHHRWINCNYHFINLPIIDK